MQQGRDDEDFLPHAFGTADWLIGGACQAEQLEERSNLSRSQVRRPPPKPSNESSCSRPERNV